MPNMFQQSFLECHIVISGTSLCISIFIGWQQHTNVKFCWKKNDYFHHHVVNQPFTSHLKARQHMLIQSSSRYAVHFSKSLSVFINTAIKANLINSLVLGPDFLVIIRPLFPNHSGYEIYEIHWERGGTSEYWHTVCTKQLMTQETVQKTRSNGNTPLLSNHSGI